MNIDFDRIWRWSMELLPPAMDTIPAKAMTIAIGLQEGDGFKARRQYNNGPARSFWQMEQGGGVRGVLNHPHTERHAKAICHAFNIEPYVIECWNAIEYNDVLACCFARLLLFTAPWPLPTPDNEAEGWRQYEWCWRPGMPHRDKWAANYAQAWQEV